MKNVFSIVLFGFFSFMLSGCGNSAPEENNESKDLKKSSFEVHTPDDWETLPSDSYPQNIVLLQREPFVSSEISTLLSVSMEQGTYYSLSAFAKRNLEMIRKNSQDFQKVRMEEISLDSGQDAIFVEYSEKYSPNKQPLGFYSLYVIDTSNKKSYVVSLLFDISTDDDHKNFLEKVVKSFTLSSA